MNIGFNPLYREKLSIEVHFFDFDTDLYDQKKKFQYLNTSVRSKNSILLIYLPNN
jgi:FAD synthase